MDDNSVLPTTKDVLGEHLFSKVRLTEPNQAEQITGVLLGASNDDILHMLQDQQFLLSQIDGVKRVLRKPSNNPAYNGTHSTHVPLMDQGLAEELFARVRELEPDQAGKVTGMILELDSDTIELLLKSSEDLRGAVRRALAALNESEPNPEAVRSSLEEELYAEVRRRQPERASVITGMLLEMDVTSLQKLLAEPVLLEHKITEALDVLEAT